MGTGRVAVTLSVGIVGCGTIGGAHSFTLKAIAKASLADVAVVATCDSDLPRAEAYARAHGAAVATTDPTEVIAVCDAVWVCTPTVHHTAVVEAAAAAGLAIFCEKPLAPTLAGAEAMARTVTAAGVPHQVGLVLRTAPVFSALREVLHEGGFGRPMAVVFRDDQFFPIQGHYASTWRRDVRIAGAGTLLEHSVHDLDLLRFLLGEVDWVTGRTANFAGHPGIEDVAVATLAFASGATATLTSVWHDVLTRPSTRRVEVFCERAHLWLDDAYTGPLHVETSAGHEVRACPAPAWVASLPIRDPGVLLAAGEYAAANLSFLEAVAAGVAPAPGFGEAVVAHRLADAVYRSAAGGGAPVGARC
jgi:predicted dehydrogenase